MLGMASHDLGNTKTTLLGATPGAIPGIDGNPHEIFSFAPPLVAQAIRANRFARKCSQLKPLFL